MRWSSSESTRAPAQRQPALDAEAVRPLARRAPRAPRGRAASAAIRSVSLCRSSAAPVTSKRTRTRRRPPRRAPAPRRSATARAPGRRASRREPTTRPRSCPPARARSGRARISTRPPIARSTSTKAVRVGESRTPSSRTSESGRTSAATTRKAALEASPGTSTVVPRRLWPPTTLAASPSRSSLAPKAGSMRSVWSRLGIGSRTLVRPSACRPASSSAVFTCALATGSSWSRPRRRPPPIVIGAWPSVVSSVAPIARSGAATRSSGRRRSDSSPVSMERNGRPASGARQHPDRRARVAGVEHGGGGAPGVEAALDRPPPSRRATRLRRGRAGTRASRRSPRPRRSCGRASHPRPSRRGSPPGARWTCRPGGVKVPRTRASRLDFQGGGW